MMLWKICFHRVGQGFCAKVVIGFFRILKDFVIGLVGRMIAKQGKNDIIIYNFNDVDAESIGCFYTELLLLISTSV
jgi:hypothetical protein